MTFEDLLVRRPAAWEISAWLRKLQIPVNADACFWREVIVPVSESVRGFEWLPMDGRNRAKSTVLWFMQRVWSEGRIPSGISRKDFDVFRSWVGSLRDDIVVRFCWDLFDKEGRPVSPLFWFKHSGRLCGEISIDNILLARGLAAEASAMFQWEPERWEFARWERDTQPYLAMLHHSSYLVRAAAAKVLGHIFVAPLQVASPADVLHMIQECETRTPGVAGPFLQGAQWSVECEPWQALDKAIDMRAWLLETLRNSSREPSIPHMQTLEFYAHEYFSFDPDAIRELLKMGRAELALMTVTENNEALDKVLPVLEEMKASEDPRVAAGARAYLAKPEHHEGMQFFDGEPREDYVH